MISVLFYLMLIHLYTEVNVITTKLQHVWNAFISDMYVSVKVKAAHFSSFFVNVSSSLKSEDFSDFK